MTDRKISPHSDAAAAQASAASLVQSNLLSGLRVLGAAVFASICALIANAIGGVLLWVVGSMILHSPIVAGNARAIAEFLPKASFLMAVPIGSLTIFAASSERNHVERLLGYFVAAILIYLVIAVDFLPVLAAGWHGLPALALAFFAAGMPMIMLLEYIQSRP